MEQFLVHTGIAAPLRRSDVDTDQIIPVRFLTRGSRTGWEDALFHDWREESDFVLNDPAYAKATVLVAGRDFGTGSSREYAVWALQSYGFRVVIAPRFGDIFRGNASTNGLLTIELAGEEVERIWKIIESRPEEPITVDLEQRTITAGGIRFDFHVDENVRWRMMNGLDHIDLTMQHESSIAEFESVRRPNLPSTATMSL